MRCIPNGNGRNVGICDCESCLSVRSWTRDENYPEYDHAIAYLIGQRPPHYPVPSTLGVVQFEAYPGITCIDTPDTDSWVIAWDWWTGELEVVHGNDPRY